MKHLDRKPMLAKDSDRLIVLDGTEKSNSKFFYRFFWIQLGLLFVAMTIVCFMAPVLDKFFDWVDESILNFTITFSVIVLAFHALLMYFKFKR